MPDTYVVDVRHYLEEGGNLALMPGATLTLALFFGSIAAWVSGWPGPDGELTNVVCRRSRARPPCHGEIFARLVLDGELIQWRCHGCGEQGTISGWRGTRWDRSSG